MELQTKTVLLLDDDPALRRLIAAPLEARKVNVLHAATGKRATELVTAHEVDLAVVDGLLPDTNGLEWIASLRLSEPDIKIIFLSRFWKDIRSFEYLTSRLGVALVMHKPVHPTEFARQVVELLDVGAEQKSESVSPPKPSVGGAAKNQVAAKLAELSVEFKASLRGRLDELRAELARAATDAAAAEKARLLAHRLAGTAGSFGFRRVSRAMAEVERELDRYTARGTLHSSVIEGATAIIDLLSIDEPTPTAATRSLAASQGIASQLLVVDDDLQFLEYVDAAAKRYNVEIRLARNRGEALAIAKSQPLVGALIDVHLDDGPAFDLADQLRALPGRARLPLAFTSVDQSIETRLRAIAAGGSSFLEKPATEDALWMVFSALVEQPRRRAGRVLIVDDDPSFCEAVEGVLLEHNIESKSVLDAGRLIEELENWPPDLILMDVLMPRISGLDLCRALRNSQRWRRIPIIVVTGKHDLQTRLSAFEAGADDFVAKPLAASELLARIGVRLKQIRMAEEYQDHDSLTGLWLRRPFFEACGQMLALAKRNKTPACLVMLDVDRFKAINDRFGHLVGDGVLARLGRLLQERLRAEDHRCRWGGEEFAIAMPNQNIETAIHALQRLLAEFSSTEFSSDTGDAFQVAFSAGIAEFPADGETMESLIRAADQRLYEAKQQGRSRVWVPKRQTEVDK